MIPRTAFWVALVAAALVPLATEAQPTATVASPKLDREAASKPLQPNSPRYCDSIADAAADARYLLQKEALAKVEGEIEGRIKILDAKRTEFEAWLKRRNAFLANADEKVVLIYSRMRPDAAAAQLATMDDEVAAAILAKLKPRSSSAILNEMEPARAAQLSNVITDAPNRSRTKSSERL